MTHNASLQMPVLYQIFPKKSIGLLIVKKHLLKKIT